MEKQTIAQRVILLIGLLGLEITSFAESLEIHSANIRNYKNGGTRPNSDLLEEIAVVYPQVNLIWLVTGREEPLLPEQAAVDASTGRVHHPVQSCQQEVETLRREVQILRDQLHTQEAIIATKEETIRLLRGA